MCDDCGPGMRALAAPLCSRCGAPTALVGRAPAGRARALRFLTTARSALWLDGPLLDLVARWKRGEIAPGRLAGRASSCTRCRGRAVQALAAVPAVRDRLLVRGADPPAELAAELGRWWDLPVVPLVTAHAQRAPAARASTRTARRRNVRDAFSARAGPRSRSRSIDDVYTTGATVDECARALRRAGAARGARDHAGTHAARSVLCDSGAPWQTPAYDAPERGGT